MVVEPRAEDTVAGNLNPVGRVYYSFSTFLCVPSALSQEGGYSLGAGQPVSGQPKKPNRMALARPASRQ